ncbi:MAG: OmpA family protein [Mailhella sp.]|nr:OmpA family protein [Mailhella sp.]
MKTFRTALLAAALVMGLVSASQAENMVRKVDSFDFLVDQSGSMMMGNGINGVTKAQNAKKVLGAVNQAIPDLGYQGSMHTFAGVKSVVPYGAWERNAMQAGIDTLAEGGPIFGKMTPMGDGFAAVSGDYANMARPTAVIIASDGANNQGVDPVAEAAAIYQAQPGICFHVISFADDPAGQATLDKIAALNNCSVSVKGADLLASQEAVDKFVADVFYGGGEEALVLHGVNFAFDSYALDAKAQGILDEAAVVLKDKGNNVVLEGWTDSKGSDAYNKRLSQNRANSVKSYLVKQGVPSSKLATAGRGKSFKYDNANEEGRYLNRRVEILFK